MLATAHKAAGARLCRAFALAWAPALALPAWGATHYVDPTAANGGSGTEGSPYNEFADITVGAGDTILLKSGTTITGQTLTLTSVANILVGIYGGTERATIDCNNAVDYGLDATQTDELSFGDVDIVGCRINNVQVDNSSATQMDVYFSDMHAGDITATQSSNWKTGTAFWVQTASGTVGRINITYTDVECSNVTSHCFAQYNEVYGMHYRSRCDGAGIGEEYGAHCFTSSPRIQTWTTGWTLVAGTTYYRNAVSSGDVEQAVCGRGGTVGDRCLVQQALDDSTLSTGEWALWTTSTAPCASGAGCIAVNFGVDPNSSAGNFSETKMARYAMAVTYVDVEATGAKSSTGDHNGSEGDGIVCDDLSIGCTIRSAWTHDNDRNGIQMRQTTGARLAGFIANNNGLYGALLQGTIDTDVFNFDVVNNRQGLRVITDYDYDVVIRNGVAAGNSTKNVSVDPQAAAQVTQSNNVSFNGGGADDSFTAAITTDPLFVGGAKPIRPWQFAPGAGSPMIAQGSGCASADFYGDAFYSTCDIGAIRRDQCYRRSADGAKSPARTRAQIAERCRGIPGRYPEGL